MELNKKFEIEYRDPESLIPYVKNAKIHSNEQIDKIAGQIAEFGFDQPIVINKDNIIIKGHGRREAAIKLTLNRVPVIIQSLDEYQEMAARIADNKVAEAPWDPEMLKFDLGTLKMHDFNLKLTAFDLSAIDQILTPPNAETEFADRDRKNVKERKEEYDNSDLRQIILVTDPVTFEGLMTRFAALRAEYNLDTNIEVVQKLLEIYDQTRSQQDGPNGSIPEAT